MLKSIKIENFCSIGEEQEMSLEITSKDVQDESATEIDGDALNLVSCVIGPNASGKTTVLKAITFLLSFIRNAYTSQKSDESIPATPHKLKEGQSTKIEVTFCDKDKFYEYYIEFNNRQVLKESLKKRIQRMTKVFELVRNDGGVQIDAGNLKINNTDEARFKERRNVPLLSSLIDTGYLSEITFFKNFKSNVDAQYGWMSFPNFVGTSQVMYKDENLRKDILGFAKEVDLGISEFLFNEIPLITSKGIAAEKQEKMQMLQCVHSSKEGNFQLPIFEESSGTQHSFSTLSEVLPILRTGGVAILDEIEAGLHPYVLKAIISLFESKKTNPHKAQLIFSTHQHLLLNDRTKTQIFITERNNENFETEVYRLDDIQGVRNDENYFHKYIAGTYGGTPKINWL